MRRKKKAGKREKGKGKEEQRKRILRVLSMTGYICKVEEQYDCPHATKYLSLTFSFIRLSLSIRFVLSHSNARTAHFQPSVPVPTMITISPDRTFTFSTRSPPVAHLLRTAAGIEKGSPASPAQGAKTGFVGKVSVKHIYEIAKIKCLDEDLKVLGLEKVARSVVGSAKSLGLEVVV